MPEAIENYVPQVAVGEMRRQAFKVWAMAAVFVGVWVLLLIAAPVAEANSFESFSQPIYKFCSFICHQIPARSLHVENHPFAVCSRCFGIYFGLFGGFLIYPLLRSIEDIEPFPRVWLFLALIPTGVDFLLGYFGVWENTHLSRFLTGAILGAACGIFIVPGLIELFRYLKSKPKTKKAI